MLANADPTYMSFVALFTSKGRRYLQIQTDLCMPLRSLCVNILSVVILLHAVLLAYQALTRCSNFSSTIKKD